MDSTYIGAVVIIKKQCDDYYLQYPLIRGRKATIRKIYSSNIALEVEGAFNNNSKYGYFYLPKKYIYFPIEEGEFDMSKINNYKGRFKIAVITFLDGDGRRQYNYRLYNDGVEYKEGDIVAVMSAYHGMGLAKIKSIYEPDAPEVNNVFTDDNSNREIVCRIDMTKYNKRKEKAQKISTLKGQMDKKVKELQGIALYEMMAKNCPELQEMLNEYKCLIN